MTSGREFIELAELDKSDPNTAAKVEEFFAAATQQVKDFGAQYKIEVIFRKEERSRHKAYPGVASAWISGGAYHGGGDVLLSFCPQESEPGSESAFCQGPISPGMISESTGVAVCARCKKTSKPSELHDNIFARLTDQNWAKLIYRMYKNLDQNADIRIGNFGGRPLHEVSKEELEKPQGGEQLYKVYRDREFLVYPQESIIRDSVAGASVESLLKALITA